MAAKNRNGRHYKIMNVTAENDLKYRGPLNYQHFQILGWLCIVVSQALVIFRLGGRLDPGLAEQNSNLESILKTVSGMSLPFLLIANFAQILDDSDGYRKQLLKNAAASLLIILFYLLMVHRYLAGSLAGIMVNPSDAMSLVSDLVRILAPNGFISFNLFIDLFLCTLVMLFLNYKPKRIFRGKLLHVFRLFALLPVAYEVACLVLKVMAANGKITLPLWTFPLLPVKPPMTFVLFLILAVFIKTRELRFRRHGKTHEEYKAFLKTNRNSWNFSIFLAVMMLVVALLDFLFAIGYSVFTTTYTMMEQYDASLEEQSLQGDSEALILNEGGKELIVPEEELIVPESGVIGSADGLSEKNTDLSEAEEEGGEEDTEDLVQELIDKNTETARALGFGGSFSLALLAPLVLLFSYTREPRMKKAGIFIPLAGIVLILFVYLEAFRMMMWNLPIEKVDLNQIMDSSLMDEFMLK